jgi:hypothetical protein
VRGESSEEGGAVVGESQRLQLRRRQQEPLAQVHAENQNRSKFLIFELKILDLPVEVEGGVVGDGGLQQPVVGGDALDAAPRAHAQPQVVLSAQARRRGAHQRHLLGRHPLVLHFRVHREDTQSANSQPLHSSNAIATMRTRQQWTPMSPLFGCWVTKNVRIVAGCFRLGDGAKIQNRSFVKCFEFSRIYSWRPIKIEHSFFAHPSKSKFSPAEDPIFIIVLKLLQAQNPLKKKGGRIFAIFQTVFLQT